MKGKKKTTILFLILILAFQSFNISLLNSVRAETEGIDQKGEVPEGYVGIYTANDLDSIRNNLAGNYILMNDLDLSLLTGEGGEFYNDGAGWTPIGSEALPFTGNLDGNGYKISGMKINVVSDKTIYAGLFGYVKNAEISNLGMTDTTVFAHNNSLESAGSSAYAGGVIGYGYNVVITNTYNTGTINAQSLFKSYAGGIAGYVSADYNSSSTIDKALNTGHINAKTYTGGIAGEIYRTNVNQSNNEGRINSDTNHGKYAGGIVGYGYRDSSINKSMNSGQIFYGGNGGGIAGYFSYSSIKDSYNVGNLSSGISNSSGGGIAGKISSSTISNTHNEGNVTGTADSTDGGGIAGEASSNSSISKSFNLGEIVADTTSGGIVGTLYSSVVAQSYNNAETRAAFSGGIGGWLSGSSITDTFNIGIVHGRYDSGGIAGNVTNSTIQNSYNVGLVKGSYDSGGIAGEFDGTILNAYYLDKSNKGVGKGIETGTVRRTMDELKLQENFSGFDFQTLWTMEQNPSFLFPELSGRELTGEERAIHISMKSNPDKISYVEGEELDLTGAVITATTNFGNIQDIVVQPEMIVDFDQIKDLPYGGYQIEVTYHNMTAYFHITIIEKDITPPGQPVVNDVTDQSTAVTGKAEAESNIEVKVGENIIGEGTTDLQGNFKVDIPVQQAGTELVLTATDSSGNTSESAIIVVKDITPPSKPVVNPVTDQDDKVTGEAEPGSTVKVFAFNNLIGSGTTGSDGRFNVSIPLQTAGMELLVGTLDSSGNPSEQVTLTVKDITPPAQAKVDPVTDQEDSVTGEGEPGSQVEVSSKGSVLGTETVWTNGGFRVSIPKQPEGTELIITLVDNAGNRSEETIVTVGDGTAPEKPVVYEVTDLSKTVTGKAEVGSLVKVMVNGIVIGQGTTNTDGAFKVEIPLQKPETELAVIASDESGNSSEAAYLRVVDVSVPVKPIVYTVTDQASIIKGEAEAGSYIEVSVDTWIIGRGKTGEDREFSISIPPQKAGTKLVITSSDAYGHMSEETVIIVQNGNLKGWINKDNNWYYYDSISGEMIKGWLKSGGKWYYLNENGVMQTGWEKVAGKWYFLNSGGDMRTGWLQSGGTWYYLDGSGVMRTGWLQTDGVWYYFDGSGAMKTGWLQTGGKWYYMSSSGAMKTGWLQTGGKWYYLYSNGVMAYNTTVNGYRLGADGAWIQ